MMQRTTSTALFSLLLLAALILCSDQQARADSGWRRIANEDGITVMQRDVAQQSFPTFRGIGTIQASIYDVVAVMSDIPRYSEWMAACLISKELRSVDERLYVIYTRTDAPWPVSDRDAVYRSVVEVNRDRLEVDIRFRAIKNSKVKKVKGVVRMEKLRGHFKLKGLGPTLTRIDYQVDADPEGWVPKWLAKLATRKLPLQTIRNMRKQVVRTRGWYTERIRRWKSGAGPNLSALSTRP
jgi:hypothetical protein